MGEGDNRWEKMGDDDNRLMGEMVEERRWEGREGMEMEGREGRWEGMEMEGWEEMGEEKGER